MTMWTNCRTAYLSATHNPFILILLRRSPFHEHYPLSQSLRRSQRSLIWISINIEHHAVTIFAGKCSWLCTWEENFFWAEKNYCKTSTEWVREKPWIYGCNISQRGRERVDMCCMEEKKISKRVSNVRRIIFHFYGFTSEKLETFLLTWSLLFLRAILESVCERKREEAENLFNFFNIKKIIIRNNKNLLLRKKISRGLTSQ
jgi:hypothetical protein